MDYQNIYKETTLFMKERWWTIFFMRLLFGVVTFFITGFLISYIFDPHWFSSLEYVTDVNPEDFEVFLISAAASSAISSILIGVINAALSINILEAYQGKSSVRFKRVYHIIKERFLSILLVLIILASVQFSITVIPYVNRVSFLLLPLINYYTIFTYFILSDHADQSAPSALTESIKLSRGHKFALFKITLHYYLRKFVGYTIIGLGFLFVTLAVMLNEGTVMSSLFMMLGLAKIGIGISVNIFMAIKFGPYATVAHAIYYEQLKKSRSSL